MTKVKGLCTVGIILSIIFVVVGCVWLSFSAETLDEVAEHFGLSAISIYSPPIPDYEIPGFEGNVAANISIGIVFTLLTLFVTFAAGKVLKAKK